MERLLSYPKTAAELTEVAAILADTDEKTALKVEAAIAECMSESGFVYEAWVAPRPAVSVTPITDSVADLFSGPPQVGPNEAYVASIQATDLRLAAAWADALQGTTDAPTAESLADGSAAEPDGCEGKGAQKVMTPAGQQRIFRILLAAAEMNSAASADKTVQRAITASEQCQIDSGQTETFARFETLHTDLIDSIGSDSGPRDLAASLSAMRSLEATLLELERRCAQQVGLDAAQASAHEQAFADVAARWLVDEP